MKRWEQERLWINAALLSRLLAILLLISAATGVEAWALQTNLTSLTFEAVQGGANPSSQTVTLYISNSRRVKWNSKDDAAWISVSPPSVTMSTAAEVVVSVNTKGLAAGTYAGTVTVTASKNGTLSIPVTLKVVAAVSLAAGATTTLTWNANVETDLAGYKVYVGTSSGLYGPPINVGTATSYVFSKLNAGVTYYFTVTAYDQSGNESLYAAEMSKSVY